MTPFVRKDKLEDLASDYLKGIEEGKKLATARIVRIIEKHKKGLKSLKCSICWEMDKILEEISGEVME